MPANIRIGFYRTTMVSLALAALAMSSHGAAQRDDRQGLSQPGEHEHRNFDARDTFALPASLSANVALDGVLRSEIDALREEMPDLEAAFDERTGAIRSLWNRVGYLTAPRSGRPLEIADGYVTGSAGLLGLFESDVADRETTDVVYSRVTGATHIYYRQRVNGIPVYNAQLHVNVNRDGRILSVNNAFVPNLVSAYNALQPAVPAATAVQHVADHLKVGNAVVRTVRVERAQPRQDTRLTAENLSAEPVNATLMLLPIRKGEVRLVWNFQVHTLDTEHVYDFTVDAESGQVWTRFDWVSSDRYRVFPAPVESPNHSAPAAPADGRTTATNPHHGVPSPFRWHDTNGVAGLEYTIMRGNNVHAYEDSDSSNTPPSTEPDCGASLDCTFPLDLAQAASSYTAAAVANLFYWNNVIHDVQYLYGFDEAAGNFQMNTYGRGGLGNDYVQAEAQDGSGTNNANFATPPDGQRPRMQMYLWSTTTPGRDGDFDNGIIVHEYGHGISNRLVGGPSNVSCLNNAQQPGEGLSDWWALVYTARASDSGPLPRGMGTYAIGQPTTGGGIRSLPYTTNTGVNSWTYASVAEKSIPHGVGAVWAQGMWRVYWALVNHHGFSADLYNAAGGAGNQRAMLYVNEGLKNAACRPAFTDVRDGIIQAAVDNYGGVDVCRMWDAFAAFGLGSDAFSGGPGSTTPTNGFNKPVSCGGTPLPALSINDVSVLEGNGGTTTATFTVSLSQSPVNEVRVGYATSDGTATSALPVTSSGPITIPNVGPATPYPSALAVAGVTGTVQRLAVRLNSLSHTYTADLDVLLVGPGGQKVMLMSDAGGSSNVSNVTLTFQDGAPALTGTVVTGTYSPTDLMPGETLPAPAPAGPYPTTLSPFNGTNPNGTWTLYVLDDEAGDVGTIASWSLLVTTAAADYVSATGQLVFPPGTITRTIAVTVNGDTTDEPNETFFVNLSNPAAATIADGLGVGTIINDDAASGPPAAAILRSPLRRMGLTPVYEWAAVQWSESYQLWVNDSSGNRIQQWYTAAQAGCASGGTCAAAPAVTLDAGTVDWWIQTRNSFGTGPWSAKSSFQAAPERFVIGLGSGSGGELQPWSSVPTARQASLDLPWPAYNALNGELHPAVGDVDGDGLNEIVVGLGFGGQGWIAVFDDAAHGFALLKWLQVPWPSYNAANGTIWPAVGDIDGDGRAEIVAGLGEGGQGFYAVYGDATQGYAFETWRRVTWPWYNTTESGETHPAVVNIDGGAHSEIIIGLGAGGGGWLEVVDDAASGYAHLRWLRVGWTEYTVGPGATYPAGGDIDGDGRGEVVVGLGSGSRGYVEVFDDAVAGMRHKAWLQVTWPAYNDAVGETHPAVGNMDGDLAMEIVIGLGRYPGQGGFFEVRDDSAAGHASLGWRNAGRGDVYAAGGATFPAVGRVR